MPGLKTRGASPSTAEVGLLGGGQHAGASDLRDYQAIPNRQEPTPVPYDHPFASATIAAIRAHQGELFHQKLGGVFHYAIDGAYIIPDRTNYWIPLKDVVVALDRAPFPSTTVLQDLRGPSFIYGILMDPRIRPSWETEPSSQRPQSPHHPL